VLVEKTVVSNWWQTWFDTFAPTSARLVSWKPVPAAAAFYGVDPSVIWRRIRSRQWPENLSWICAPNGDILINTARPQLGRDNASATEQKPRIWIDPPKFACLSVAELRKPGIYFLTAAAEVVYIGQSKCLMSRIGGHLLDGLKEFDSVSWITCEARELNRLERAHIAIYRPRLNVKVPA
jgi:hypothetical protein